MSFFGDSRYESFRTTASARRAYCSFFQEYFDYDRVGSICKDTKALASAGGDARKHYQVMFGMTAPTDRLIELILQEDKDVVRELLTAQRVVLDPRGNALYFSEFEKLTKSAPQSKKEERLAGDVRCLSVSKGSRRTTCERFAVTRFRANPTQRWIPTRSRSASAAVSR